MHIKLDICVFLNLPDFFYDRGIQIQLSNSHLMIDVTSCESIKDSLPNATNISSLAPPPFFVYFVMIGASIQ